MSTMHIQIEAEGLTKILDELGDKPNHAKMALRTAINQTAKETIVLIVDEIPDRYEVIKPTEVRKTLSLQKATVNKLYAVITSKGRVNELYSFKVKPRGVHPKNRPTAGHTGRVLRASSDKYIYYSPGSQDQHKAFTVQYASKHKTLAQRIPGSERETPREDHPNGEEAIKTLYSPSVPKMLDNTSETLKKLKPEISLILYEHVQEQVAKYVGNAASSL